MCILLVLCSTLCFAGWDLASYFPNIQVITMNPQSTRFQRCVQEFEAIGLKPHEYELVLGIDGKTISERLWGRMNTDDILRKQGRMGCFMTHYNIIKETHNRYQQAKRRRDVKEMRKYKTLLIIEDNCGFGQVTGCLTASHRDYDKIFKKVMRELPRDWDMLYFMSMKCDNNPVQKISPHLAKLSYGVVTKCYAIHSRFYGAVLAALENELKSDRLLDPVDNVIATLHSSSNCFVITPPLIYRVASQSFVYGGDSTDSWNWQSDAAG